MGGVDCKKTDSLGASSLTSPVSASLRFFLPYDLFFMRRDSLSILKACSYIFYLICASGSHVTWNSAVPDPNVWCCILLFLCTLDGKRPYIVTSHSTHRVSPVSLWPWKCDCSSSLDLDSWNSVGASFVWKSTSEENEDTVDCRSRKPSFQLNAKYPGSQSSPGIHTACTPPVLFQVQPEKKSLLAQTSLALQPLPLAFCQFPKVNGVIIWPKLPKTTAGANITLSLCVYVLRTLSWETCGRKKKTPMALHLLSGSVWPFSVSKNWPVEESTGS